MVPIDNALENLESQNKSVNSEKVSTNESKDIFYRAKEVITPSLIKFFSFQLPGQDSSAKKTISPINELIISQVGFETLYIYPKDGRSMYLSLNSVTLNENIIKEMLKIMCGEYVLETDIINLIDGNSIEKLTNLLPEFQAFKSEVIREGRIYQLATIDPYIVTMGMDFENRPLAILAVQNASSNGRIRVLNNTLEKALEKEIIGNNFLRMLFQNITPITSDYVTVAKTYGIKNILPTMENFRKVCNDYIDRWAKK